ncbi:hypothetical protein ZIOFF_033997 [Zingiber officinale]|uniref:Uncharacterized protein n=1 Tax=Zingiber officinale TaxID=94328 RepID=A0A8J5GXS8_ZINOF|nr:hypothetical protein ZIOFF_033997 [Zingiber officinale]
MATGQMLPSGGQMNFAPTFGANQQYYNHNPAIQSLLATHQHQQLQIRSQHPQQLQPHRAQPRQVQQQSQPPVDLTTEGPLLPFQNRFGKAPFDNMKTHE